MSGRGSVVVAGAGQAGLETAASLRSFGYEGRVVLIGDEPGLPYQRPPLSKALLAGDAEAGDVVLRPDAFFAKHEIELLAERRVATIDRTARTVSIDDGTSLRYEHLVLATGSRNRTLELPGGELDGVVSLRTLADALELRQRLGQAQDVAIVGAGFIGLEVATVARSAGRDVTVFEIAERPMSRMLSEPTARFFTGAHRGRGVDLRLGTGIGSIVGSEGRVAGVVDTTGRRSPAQLVVIAVGVAPADELAAAAGLPVAQGIVVDDRLASADPSVFAVGDCARFPCRFGDTPVLLESVQNAVDQGRAAAAQIVGRDEPYAAVPWFWSDQAGVRLQIAGLTAGADELVVVGEPEAGRFSTLCFARGQLRGVESVASPGDHVAARRVLARPQTLSLTHAQDRDFDLRTYARAA